MIMRYEIDDEDGTVRTARWDGEWVLYEDYLEEMVKNAVIADALAAELESLTVVDAMVHRLQIRELGDGYRAALRWCLAALEEQATSGFDHRRAVQAARKALKEEE